MAAEVERLFRESTMLDAGRRKAVLLMLVAVLVSPWASVASSKPESRAFQATAQPAALNLLSRLWISLRGIAGKAGCLIDPSGLCVKEGCGIDPSGRCLSEVKESQPTETKKGCNIDPSGRCVNKVDHQIPIPRPKAGCNIDPSGRCIP